MTAAQTRSLDLRRGVSGATARMALFVPLFLVLDVFVFLPIAGSELELGWDALVYTEGMRRLLGGGDPWSGTLAYHIGLAAPAPGLLPYLPFVWLPDVVVRWSWIVIAGLSAGYAIRRLELPPWWILFPPVLLAVATGGTALPVLALLVRGGAYADGFAVVMRVYAAVPLVLLGRWRGLVVAAAVFLVTAPFMAWPTFLGELPRIGDLLASQTSGGLSATGLVIPVAIVGLILLRRQRAAWLVVPALWPQTQHYYAVIALPALASLPLTTIALALPGGVGAVAFGMVLDGLLERLPGRRARTADGSSPAVSSSG
jgi:hypothetical protein